MSGSSNYPEQVDNHVQLQDGIDIVQADDHNDSYAAQNAQQTFIGASGVGQGHNTDILAVLDGLLPGISLTWIDADTIRASAGVIVCKNASGSIRKLRKNTGTTNITFSDIDTGARAINTQYYVYAIADSAGTTVTFKISTSASTPTGATVYKLIGKFKTDGTGSGNIYEGSLQTEFPLNNFSTKNVLEIVIGSYTGNGVDNRDITIGFSDTTKTPKFVLMFGTTGGHWMFNGQSNGYAPSDASSQVNGIKSFGANKFVVGTNAEANQNATTKYFLAIG